VTGAGRGIGRVIALTFARAGASIALASRTEAELLAVAHEIEEAGRDALAYTADVSDEGSVKALAKAIGSEWGYLDIVINNAAQFARGPVASLSLADWNRVLATNLTGPFLVCREMLPLLRKGTSRTIVFLSSTAGKRGYAEGSAYAASKHGIMGLAHSLLYEVRGDDIRVVVVSPSLVDTRRVKGPLAREGKGSRLRSEDVAEAVLLSCALPGRALVRDVEIWATNP
jgi:3-oxoacyl-[acyl-carrier protein] reductase